MSLRALLACLVLAAVLALPLGAGAVVPPKNCGIMRIEGKRFQVKVDQITCRTGRSYASRYVRSDRRPRGYRCKDYPRRRNRVNFYCNDGRRIFFGIAR